jgi:hypothetical protein
MYVGPIVLFITTVVLQFSKAAPTALLSGMLNYLAIIRAQFAVTPAAVAL